MKPKKNVKVGRNELCPCGSGKKFKKCCLPKQEEQRSTFNSNGVLIENTVGTGLPTLVAKNLGLIGDIKLPKKGNREELDFTSLKAIKNKFANEKITIHPKPDGSIGVKTKNGIIVLEN